MARRLSRRQGGTASPPAREPAHPAERARRWLLGGVIALLVARPYVPGTGVAAEGHGASFAVLWPLLLCGWAVCLLATNTRQFRPRLPDWAGLLLVMAYLISGSLAAAAASPRPALNMIGQVVAMAIAYWMVRQLVRSPQEVRATVAILLAVGFAMALVGLYQYAIDLPHQQRQYEAVKDDPQELFAWSGQWLADDPAARKRFEDRLYTREPYGTLALSNSLAGFLVPWLVVLPGMLFATWSTPAGRRLLVRGGWVAMWIVLAMCLVLTGSRSGFLAVIAGLCAVAVSSLRSPVFSLRRYRVTLAIASISLVSAAGIATAIRNTESVDLASRSLGYRWEYWQATCEMISDYPLLGCGPGQFQETYTAYKLPEASEEVADPHNFLLEVWATAGTFAVVGLVGLLAGTAWSMRRRPASTDPRPHHARNEGKTAGALEAMYLGGGVGVVLGPVAAIIAQIPVSTPHAAILAIGISIAVAVLHSWVVSGRLPERLLGAAVIAQLVHLTASGGISDPTIAGGLWTFLALLVTSRDDGTTDEVVQTLGSRRVALAWLAAAGVMLAGAWATVYRPVVAARGHLATAVTPEVLRRPAAYAAELRKAVEADPWSARVSRLLARVQLEDTRAARSRSDATIERWIASNDRTLRLASRAAQLYSESSRAYRDLYERFAPSGIAVGNREQGLTKLLDRAVLDAGRAVARYPSHASYRLELADVLALRGSFAAAAEQYAAAVAMDEAKLQAGHLDKILPSESRVRADRRLRELTADQSPSAAATPQDAN